MLNDACSSLYGNTSKGITARSLNIDDIEKYMKEEVVKRLHKYTKAARYGEQVSSAYTNNKYYPVIYAEEKLSVINGNKKTTGLGMSEQTSFIEKNANNATDGNLYASRSIQPYQTYWSEDTYMPTAFRTAEGGANYYNLLINSSKYYWLASRCINTFKGLCRFSMRSVNIGAIYSYDLYSSDNNNTDFAWCALFPVVSLSSSLLSGNATSGYTVN